jgi:tight adherence protein B
LLGQLSVIFLTAMVFVFKFDLNPLSAVFLSIFLTLFFSVFFMRILTNKRQAKFVTVLPMALDIISRAIRAGHSLERTLPMLAREVPDPVGKEFKKISEQLELGVSFEDTFREASLRVDLGDFYFFTSALIIQRQAGGSLSEIIENIVYVLHRRHEIRLKAKALTAEGRITGLILGALPVLFWVVIVFMRPEYLDYFLKDPFGKKLLYTAIGLLFAQYLTVRWMVNLKVD